MLHSLSFSSEIPVTCILDFLIILSQRSLTVCYFCCCSILFYLHFRLHRLHGSTSKFTDIILSFPFYYYANPVKFKNSGYIFSTLEFPFGSFLYLSFLSLLCSSFFLKSAHINSSCFMVHVLLSSLLFLGPAPRTAFSLGTELHLPASLHICFFFFNGISITLLYLDFLAFS